MNMIARLRTPERVKSGLKRHTASTQQLQSPESNLKSLARKKVSTLGSNHDADEYQVPQASDASISKSRRQLLSRSERFIEEKGQELEFKREEARAKRKNLKKLVPK